MMRTFKPTIMNSQIPPTTVSAIMMLHISAAFWRRPRNMRTPSTKYMTASTNRSTSATASMTSATVVYSLTTTAISSRLTNS